MDSSHCFEKIDGENETEGNPIDKHYDTMDKDSVSVTPHHFFPEEAWSLPPCWAALFALLAAADCALAAKPPELIS